MPLLTKTSMAHFIRCTYTQRPMRKHAPTDAHLHNARRTT